MIDIRKLKELVRLMVANDLTELDLRDSEEQVTLRRPSQRGEMPLPTNSSTTPLPAARTAPVAPETVAAPAAPATAAAPTASDGEPAGSIELLTIESPMVGTFYSRPNPDADPFVSVGSRVSPDTVVCLVEAMKIFNEIKAEVSGTVEQVLVNSGEAIEFGQPLFAVRPA